MYISNSSNTFVHITYSTNNINDPSNVHACVVWKDLYTFHSPQPPLPKKSGANAAEIFGSEYLQYFSTEQVQMLAEMFNQVVETKEKEVHHLDML